MRWFADLLVAGTSVLLVVTSGTHEQVQSLDATFLLHAAKLLAGAALVATWAVFPVGDIHSPNAARLVGACFIGAALVIGFRARQTRETPAAEYWTRVLLGALAFAMACYASYIPAAGYTPVGRGIANRTNVLAEVGLVAAAYATVRVLSISVAARWRVLRAGVIAALGTCLIAGGYVAGTLNDEAVWDAAADDQAVVLRRLGHAVQHPSRRATLVVFGAPGFISPGIPVFYAPWDLTGAVELRWRDKSLTALPVRSGIEVACERAGIELVGGDFTGLPLTRYSEIVYVDVRTERSIAVPNRASCLAWPYQKFGIRVTG
jgi:hypothetical protein